MRPEIKVVIEDFVHAQLVDGIVQLSTRIGNWYNNEDPEVEAAIENWKSKTVLIEIQFTAAEVLEAMIDERRYTHNKGHGYTQKGRATIEVADKPIFDALRADLVRMIERIDALRVVKRKAVRLPDSDDGAELLP